MFRMRKEDTSVYLYIKDIALSYYIETQEYDTVIHDANNSTDDNTIYTIYTSATPSPFERGRGLVYFDDLTDQYLVPYGTISGTKEQTERVKLYDSNMTLIDDNDYIVDYVDGYIINPTVEPAYATYDWNYVSVVDEWSSLSAADPPVVVIDINATKKSGFQLGAGKKSVRKGSLTIFASSNAERNDIAELLYDSLYLKSCPNYAFPNGTVLDYDGTFAGRKDVTDKDDNEFSRVLDADIKRLEFDNVEMKHINLPISTATGNDTAVLSDLNAHRSKITFDLVSYMEGY